MPLQIIRNDITKVQVDAIVNAANNTLLGGGGVDGAIHRAAGPGLLAECRTLNGCATGEAKITGGYDLPCKYVIHTVGPIWQDGHHRERELLVSCYRKSLELAKANGCETVAFPLISAGVYGYPKAEALHVAIETIGGFLLENDMTVYIVVFDRTVFNFSTKLFADIAEYIDDRYVDTHSDARRERLRMECVCAPMAAAKGMVASTSLTDMLKDMDAGFSETLLNLIDRSGKKDSEIYKKANIDRKLFSKIRKDPGYHPSKTTAIALAIALELDLEQTKDLIARAGYTLTHSSHFDIIIEFFIQNKDYDVFRINEVLFGYDQSLLGNMKE
ncbi:MAG: O-acetyl-ADP-ribose deacetylase [Clostridia bacterium]|nr:O-acetyl-ADP-ribose deacetylase [Clostridia bacterium]